MDRKAAIAYRPRKENPFSAAAHQNGPAAVPCHKGLELRDDPQHLQPTAAGSPIFHATLRVVFGGRRKSLSN